MEDLLRTLLYHSLRTNQMEYINVKAQLPEIYGNVNQPRPRASYALGLGQFTAINPRQLGFNYYLYYTYVQSYAHSNHSPETLIRITAMPIDNSHIFTVFILYLKLMSSPTPLRSHLIQVIHNGGYLTVYQNLNGSFHVKSPTVRK